MKNKSAAVHGYVQSVRRNCFYADRTLQYASVSTL